MLELTSPATVISFLQTLFDKGLSYSTLNTARSAISTYLDLSGLEPLGKNSIVSRFMKGVFNRRPSLPRYSEIWDPCIVLNYFRANDLQDLPSVTRKCVFLLSLATCQRISTIHCIKLCDISFSKDNSSCILHISEMQKQTRPGYHNSRLHVESYQEPVVCPVVTLRNYIELTSEIRKEKEYLFVVTVPPYSRASKDTLARWQKTILNVAGVESKFKPHSVRSAATSKMFQNKVPVDVIMQSAGWSGEDTFQKFYNKPKMSASRVVTLPKFE